jgi:hypothetical protein
MTASSRWYALTGHITVELPPDEAFRLFTPLGEQDWVPGWQPRFAAPTSDDSAPGTVFQTSAHGEDTVWVVTDREWGRRIRYARFSPPSRAGMVTVVLADSGGRSDVTVTYELAALTPAADTHLERFAAGYPEFLATWQEGIEAWLRGRT